MRRDLPERLSDALEEVIGLAILDPAFARSLVLEPLAAVRTQALALSPVELRALDSQRAADLPTYTRGLVNWWHSLEQASANAVAVLPRRMSPNATRSPGPGAAKRRS